ncbi:MAG TPA: hypothetical protein VE779_01270 [Candidatus Angelobacter sp.]|jgi:hypothetical protein|nr:hypothetical protein [Candidatus Angelobacter sp.]
MNANGFTLALAVLLLPGASTVAQQIPAGTALPVMLHTTLDSNRSKPGDKVTGRLMQAVTLPSGERIEAGAKVEGQVVRSLEPAAPLPAMLELSFDRLRAAGKVYPISVSLRALASMHEVFDAQLPVSTFDEYGTSISDWTTVQVGGAAVYLGDGTVREAMEVVGRAPAWGVVTAKLAAAPKRGCPADPVVEERPQSLWVFSPWACGIYGFEDLAIGRLGTSQPWRIIQLTSPKAVRVRGGSGWLLLVVEPAGRGEPAKADASPRAATR